MNPWLILGGLAILALVGKRADIMPKIPSPGKPTDKRRAFVQKIWGMAEKIALEKGWKRDIIITQAAHESGWGTSQLAAKYNNLFGFTEGGWQAAGKPVVDLPTTEWLAGKATKVSRYFRVYDTWEDSLRDWARLITSYPRYAPAVKAIAQGDMRAFSEAMQKAGYATDPTYGAKLARVYGEVERVAV